MVFPQLSLEFLSYYLYYFHFFEKHELPTSYQELQIYLTYPYIHLSSSPLVKKAIFLLLFSMICMSAVIFQYLMKKCGDKKILRELGSRYLRAPVNLQCYFMLAELYTSSIQETNMAYSIDSTLAYKQVTTKKLHH